MFDKVGEAAERLATSVSRRAFLGRVGQGALGLAAVIGGVLALPSPARAGNGGGWCVFPGVPGLAGSCRAYKSIKGGCPCGGDLVANNPNGCVKVNCGA